MSSYIYTYISLNIIIQVCNVTYDFKAFLQQLKRLGIMKTYYIRYICNSHTYHLQNIAVVKLFMLADFLVWDFLVHSLNLPVPLQSTIPIKTKGRGLCGGGGRFTLTNSRMMSAKLGNKIEQQLDSNNSSSVLFLA